MRTLLGLTMLFVVGAGVANAESGEYLIPVPVNETGDGILRFSLPEGVTGPVWLTIGTHSDNKARPFETFMGDIGPFTGPEIAILYSYIKHSQINEEDLAFELYLRDPYKQIARFKPVVDPNNAEPQEHCGEVSMIGECSIKGSKD